MAAANIPALPMYTTDQTYYIRQMHDWHNQMIQYHEQQRKYHQERANYFQQYMGESAVPVSKVKKRKASR